MSKGVTNTNKSREIEASPINVEIICNVHSFFNNFEKTALWLRLDNRNLGATPLVMMRSGRSKKLLQWIEQALDTNRPLAEQNKTEKVT